MGILYLISNIMYAMISYIGGKKTDHQGSKKIGRIGAVGYVSLGAGWFSEISLMPGIYKDWGGSDLGSEFQVRSLIAIGKRFKNGQAVSLALTHKSNASTAARNPGVDSLLLRWHVSFN